MDFHFLCWTLAITVVSLGNPALTWATDICDQAASEKVQRVFLDSDAIEFLSPAHPAPFPHKVLNFGQELRLACRKVIGQSQSLNWNTPTACKDLMDKRPNDPARTYFDGPNDPRRCLMTYQLKGFESQLRGFLEARDFKDDGGGHRFNSFEVQGLMQTLQKRGECGKPKALAARFDCYLKSFEAMTQKLTKLSSLLASKEKKTKSVCEGFRESGLSAQEVNIVAKISQNRRAPSQYANKNYPAYTDCHQYDLPYLFKGCTGKADEAHLPSLTDLGWSCLHEGIKRVAGESQFEPPRGYTNPIRDRLVELRAKAIELSLFARQCVLDFKTEGLFDGTLKPTDTKEAAQRCLVGLFEDFRKETSDPVAWLRKLQAKEKEMEADSDGPDGDDKPVPSPKSQQDCPPSKAAPDDRAKLENLAANSIKAVDQIAQGSPSITLSAEVVGGVRSSAASVSSEVDLDDGILALIQEPTAKQEESPTNPKTVDADTGSAQTAGALPPELLRLQQKMQIPLQNEIEKEKNISGAARQKAKLANYRSPSELILAAQAELKNFKEKRESDFDFGQFFLETEANGTWSSWSQERYQTFLAHYLTKKDEYETFAKNLSGSFSERVRALMVRINQDFLKDYTAGNALLSDFLSGRGGNCEAETKFIYTVLRDLHLRPEGDWVLGVQLFDDHAQPVLFNKVTRHVVVLHTMEEYDGLIGPIFHPEILLHGYLKRQLTDTVLTENELLIEGLNSDEKKWAIARGGKGKAGLTNTNLWLPKTGVAFGDGRVPAHAEIAIAASNSPVKKTKDFKPKQSSSQTMHAKDNGKGGVSFDSGNSSGGFFGLVMGSNGEPLTMSLNDLDDPRPGLSDDYREIVERVKGNYSQKDRPLRQLQEVGWHGGGPLVFRTRQAEHRYLAGLQKGKKPSEALVPIFEDDFDKVLHSKEFEDAKLLFANPLRVQTEGWSVDRVQKVEAVISNVYQGLLGEAWIVGDKYIRDFSASEQGDQKWQRDWVKRHPEIEGFLKIRDERIKYIDSHASEVLKVYSTFGTGSALDKAMLLMSHWGGKDLARLVNKINRNKKYQEGATDVLYNRKLFRDVLDPNLIGFTSSFRSPVEMKPTLEKQKKIEKKKQRVLGDLKLPAGQEEIERIGIEKSAARHGQQDAVGAGSPDRIQIRIEIPEDGVSEDSRDKSSQKKDDGEKNQGKARIERPVGPKNANGEQDFARRGSGSDSTGRSLKAEPKAATQLLPENFERLLSHALWSTCNDSDHPCSQNDFKKMLSRWTPSLSLELVRRGTQGIYYSSEDWFRYSGYRKILSTRDPRTFTLPGPTGEKIPTDIALLWLSWAPKELPKNGRSALHGIPDDQFDTRESFSKQVIGLYGSLEGYKSTLRDALRRQLIK